jgi:hypothetical protein
VPTFDGVGDSFDATRLAIDWATFTVMAWVWLDSTGVKSDPVIIGQEDAGVRRWRLSIDDAHGANAALKFTATVPRATAAAGSFHAFKDQWTHVAASRQHFPGGANLSIYQNGRLMGSDNTANVKMDADERLQFGSADGEANFWWKGKITDVRYYTRGLSIGEITHIYRTTRYHPYADIWLRPTRKLLEPGRMGAK